MLPSIDTPLCNSVEEAACTVQCTVYSVNVYCTYITQDDLYGKCDIYGKLAMTIKDNQTVIVIVIFFARLPVCSSVV